MTHVEPRTGSSRKPRFDCWNLATTTSGLRIFQSIGSVCALLLIGSVGSHFSPTYAALVTSTMAAILGTTLLLIFAFNLHSVTKNVDWIFWVGPTRWESF
ncbi:unnamed protein product [Haemonchus placei]|uniref:Transmembrane protein n=1 Tax=Haemonchus placei TaxID=6290 RepID=A0A0N4VT12_HAEPC|nr:unnamed protein product [Haemonchus placei]